MNSGYDGKRHYLRICYTETCIHSHQKQKDRKGSLPPTARHGQAEKAVLFIFFLFSVFFRFFFRKWHIIQYLCSDGYASNPPLNPRFVTEASLSARCVRIYHTPEAKHHVPIPDLHLRPLLISEAHRLSSKPPYLRHFLSAYRILYCSNSLIVLPLHSRTVISYKWNNIVLNRCSPQCGDYKSLKVTNMAIILNFIFVTFCS